MIPDDLKKTVNAIIVFRSDASADIGTGHVMRCIALGQELASSGCEIHFITSSPSMAVSQRISDEGFTVHTPYLDPGTSQDAELTCSIAAALSAQWIILDGYHFGNDFQRSIKKGGFCMLCIDDLEHAQTSHPDLILNQNIYAWEGNSYHHIPRKKLLLGPRYALLRREIQHAKPVTQSHRNTGKNILITMGGSDPTNATMKVLQTLFQLPKGTFGTTIIIGGTNTNRQCIEKYSRESGHIVDVMYDVKNMAEAYSRADVAITSGGTTTLELAYFGVPMLVITIAENQKRVAESLHRIRAAIDIGEPDIDLDKKLLPAVQKILHSPELRHSLSAKARALVDGRGTKRVADKILESLILLEKANSHDCKTVFAWINDPEVRENSFNSNPITWNEHMQWFTSKVGSPDSLYLIIRIKNLTPVGQVRYDMEGKDAIVSILVDPQYRNRNISVRALRQSARLLFNITPVESIHAYIKSSNKISCRAFTKAGYAYTDTVPKGNGMAYHMKLVRT